MVEVCYINHKAILPLPLCNLPFHLNYTCECVYLVFFRHMYGNRQYHFGYCVNIQSHIQHSQTFKNKVALVGRWGCAVILFGPHTNISAVLRC